MDLAPNDFFFYPTAEKELKGKHFPTGLVTIKTLEAILKLMTNTGFQNIFFEWQQHWKKCVALHGDYFKHDQSVDL